MFEHHFEERPIRGFGSTFKNNDPKRRLAKDKPVAKRASPETVDSDSPDELLLQFWF